MDTPALNPEEKLELSSEQKLLILDRWNDKSKTPPSVMELLKLTFGETIEPKYRDARSKYGKLIKEYLASNDLKYPTAGIIELKEEDKEYIKNNCSTMSAFEMGKEIFKNPKLGPNSVECKMVKDFIQSDIPKEALYDQNDAKNTEYRPPKTIEQACHRINIHVEGANFDAKKITPTQKKQCLTLISYMHNFRFSHHFNLISNEDDKKLFQNTFVKYIYDKTDLSQEDLDQYLTLANEAVMESSIKRMISMLEGEQQKTLDETGRLNMALIEAIKTSRDEYNACRKRQDSLYKALDVERSKRRNERTGPQFTLISIVEEMKHEERRRPLVGDADKRNEKILGEFKRLSTMDERYVRLYGIDEDLIING